MKVMPNDNDDQKVFEVLGEVSNNREGVVFTLYGIRMLLELNKTALKVLSYLIYNDNVSSLNVRKTKHGNYNVVHLALPDEEGFRDKNGCIVFSYQNYRRGIKNLIDKGFLLKADTDNKCSVGREWRWYYNNEYFKILSNDNKR